MNIASDSSGLLVGYRKDHIELAKMVLYIINPNIRIIRYGRYINKINLNTLEKAYSYNRFERAFRLTVGLAVIDLI